MNCPTCKSQNVVKNGTTRRQDNSVVQKYQCKACKRQFNERTGTPMSRLRTSSVIVGAALNVRTEGLGIRATGRSFGKSHSTIMRWEQRLAQQTTQWSPPHRMGLMSRSKEMKCTLVSARTFPPEASEGWTIQFIERQSRYGITAQAGKKQTQLFELGTQRA